MYINEIFELDSILNYENQIRNNKNEMITNISVIISFLLFLI